MFKFGCSHKLWHTKEKDNEPITDEVVNAVLTAIDQTPENLLTHLFYRLRGAWVNQQTEHKNLRTFWYVDNNDIKQTWTKRRKQIGMRDDGHMYNDGEWQPPYLSQWSTHLLYHMGWIGENWGRQKRGQWYVHPLDIITES